MSVQTSYSAAPAVAMPGQVETALRKESRTVSNAEGVDSGIIVCASAAALATGGVTCREITATGDVTNLALGMTCYNAIKEPDEDGGRRFAQKDTISVLRQGTGWVQVAADIASDAAVYVVHETAGGNAGKIGGTAGTGDNEATLLPGARTIIGAAAGGLALVALNLP